MPRAVTRTISPTVPTRRTRSAASTRRPAGCRSAAATVRPIVRRHCTSSSWVRRAGSSRTRPTRVTNCSTSPTRRSGRTVWRTAFRTSFLQNSSVQVNQQGGADAGLEAETSKNLTFGTVFQPTFGPEFGNLSLAIDWFRVEIKQRCVAARCGLRSLDGCYNDTRPEYCQFVSRAPFTGPGTGQLTVVQTYINVATDMVKGIDFTPAVRPGSGSG